ncbi:unnamed protein product [Heligmosomoides polygyrus]|uniref:Endo/exonuclease/phosphatase domain-containing protein n=1 Tax=Heligmosomoides polygyrus TaxID=6339 RepID=A0A183G2A8_HELPZ|nr:unnamed protein product [Heligmosomoides polygyrus]
MTVQVSRDSATASAGADAHLQSPASEKNARVPDARAASQTIYGFSCLLDENTAEVQLKDVIVVANDLNGHVDATKNGYSCHGGFGYGSRNADSELILEYAELHNLTIVNTVFRRRDSHLISFYSGKTRTQTDFVLVKDHDRCLVTEDRAV